MTDFRALCVELVDDLKLCDWPYKLKETIRADIDRARTALADEPAVPEGREPASVTGQPSDEDLLETLDKATAAFPPRHPEAEGLNAVEYPLALELRKARAVLARWGNPAPVPAAEGEVDCISIDEMCEILRSLGIKAAEYTDCTILYELTFEQLRAICDTRAFALSRRTPAAPADGEVAELMEGLRLISDGMSAIGHDSDSWFVARAAELLQRQVMVPVPVSERWPGPEVCVPHPRTKRGNWCWGFERCEVSLARPARWRLMHMETVEMEASHWLPAHALPIPHQQENAND